MLRKKKGAPTVFLSLSGKAREIVLEMDADDLNREDGMKILYDKLDALFEIDSTQQPFQHLMS